MAASRFLVGLAIAAALSAPAGAAERWPQREITLEAFARGDFATAHALLEEELAQCRAAHPVADECLNHELALAPIALSAGDAMGAEGLAQAALATATRTLPANHPDLAAAYNNVALAAQALGRFEEAAAGYRRALAVLDAGGADPLLHATMLTNLATALDALGRRGEAEALFRQAIAARRAALPAGHPDLAVGLSNLAANLDAQGRFDEGEQAFREALAILDAALPQGHPIIATVLANLAGNLDQQGRPSEAEGLLRRSLAMRLAILPAGHRDVAAGLDALAANLTRQGRAAEAEPLLRRSLAIVEAGLPPGHRDVSVAINNLAGTLVEEGKDAEAEPLFRRALAIQEAALPPSHPDLATTRANLAASLDALGRVDEAEAEFRRARSIRAALSSAHPQRIRGAGNFALFLMRRRADRREPRALFAEAGAGALERVASFPGFTPAAALELKRYRPLFLGEIEADWDLAARR